MSFSPLQLAEEFANIFFETLERIQSAEYQSGYIVEPCTSMRTFVQRDILTADDMRAIMYCAIEQAKKVLYMANSAVLASVYPPKQ